MTKKPNIVFILADDLGWGDLSCYGRPDYTTPHLDQMALDGVRLTDCYSGSSTCSPTRMSLMTGRYPARHPTGLFEPLLVELHGKEHGLEPEFPTMPRYLQEAGYRTGLIGKWHCGVLPKYGPLKSGFDEFYGMHESGVTYFNHVNQAGEDGVFEGEEAAKASGYLTHALTEKACDFIRRQKDGPFYLSVHYSAPHWPWEAPYESAEEGQLPHTGGGSLTVFAEMMKALDEGVGEILKTVKAAGIDGNTLVVFTSDNGGERYSYHYPLTGYIRLLREGGIRVPGIVRWPGLVPPRQTLGQVAITMDWSVSFLALAGIKPSPRYPLDGVNLIPVLSGEQSPFERSLFWRTTRMDAARRGPWKYLRDLDAGTEHLFNLVRDIREYHDFKDRYPDVFLSLKEEYAAWEASVLPRPERQPMSSAAGNFRIF
jgi:arylsulfatase A-like enzyme